MYILVNMKKAMRYAVFPLLAAIIVLIASGSGAAARLASAQQDSRKVAIIMYHSILKDSARQGKYVVSPAVLEADLKYLTENGYTTVTVSDLADYVFRGKELPEKPVMLTFDDGYYNNYLYAFPLMKKYNCKMVLSVVGTYSDQFSETKDENAYYSHCTWDEINEMMESGLVEIQNHSYNMHSYGSSRHGSRKRDSETKQQYTEVFTADVEKMQQRVKEMTGYTPTAFTYPYGAVCAEAEELIRQMGFIASFTCEEKITVISTDPESLYTLHRWLRPAGTDSKTYFEQTVKLGKYFGGIR